MELAKTIEWLSGEYASAKVKIACSNPSHKPRSAAATTHTENEAE